MTVLDYRSASSLDSGTDKTSGHWLAWAVYLAMSWTWCIGMFLPVLLVRDYGLEGWFAFAIPNVLGAAAMGWVLRSREASTRLAGAHRWAAMTFSFVTIAFQFFFAGWMFHGRPLAWLLPATVVLAGALLIRSPNEQARRRYELITAAGVLVVSAICAWLVWRALGPPGIPMSLQPGLRGLAFLSPVMAFGFLLCPYLDLTFHRARQQLSARDAPVAFSAGFAVIFVAMIAFSLVYAGFIPPIFSRPNPMTSVANWALAVYLMVQLALTSGLHGRQITAQAQNRLWTAVPLFSAAVLLGLVGTWLSEYWPMDLDNPRRPPQELTYRLFMGFYGLVFPAYVWLCMIPSPRAVPSRRSLLVFAGAVLIAAPMFWQGFIQGEMIWLLPGLAVVLLARLAVPASSRLNGRREGG